MLEIQNRQNCFYWQTDRDLSVQDYEKYFLRRHEISSDEIISVLRSGIKSLPNISEVSVVEPDQEVKRGNVNIVRKVMIDGHFYVARMHPFGVRNGYFYVEKVALDIASKAGVPVPKILEVHEAKDEHDMDFVLMSASKGVTMQTIIERNKSLESSLLFEAGGSNGEITWGKC